MVTDAPSHATHQKCPRGLARVGFGSGTPSGLTGAVKAQVGVLESSQNGQPCRPMSLVTYMVAPPLNNNHWQALNFLKRLEPFTTRISPLPASESIMGDPGGVGLTHLRTWCATQVSETQKDSRGAIIDIVKRFMNKVSDLMLVHATVCLPKLHRKNLLEAMEGWRDVDVS